MFESLIGELSASMAQASANRVNSEIETWLGRICLSLGLDRSAVYERDGAGRSVRTTHTWLRENIPPFPRSFDPEKLVKKCADWVMSGNQVVFSSPDEIPSDFPDLKRFVLRYGPKASAIIPMFGGDRVIGAVSFGKFGSPRRWSPLLLDQLRLAVRIFGGAIERKQAELAMRTLRSELALAQRRSTAGELVGSLAHELNQPLGAILSNLEGIARLLSQDDPQLPLASRAARNAIEDAKRAGEVVRRVRAIFKSEGSHKAAIDIRSLVKEVIGLVGNEATFREVRLQLEDAAQTARVLADRIQVQQCIVNLIMNAFDATAQVEPGRRQVTVQVAQKQKGWIQISICDTGGGVNPAVEDKIFEPFVTTKTGGMGLGLRVTQSIIEGHGGRLWFVANPGGGTTFTFTLPVAAKPRSYRTQSIEPASTAD